MRRQSKGGGGRAIAAIARPPTWPSEDLTGGAGPSGERVCRVAASLVSQTATGLLECVCRTLRLADDNRLRTVVWPGDHASVANFSFANFLAQLLEDRCG